MAAADNQQRRTAGTPEPPAARTGLLGSGNSFVIQEHHARALHWDFRLERDGVLVSWAIPKGLPDDPGTNHLAVEVPDHALEHAGFEGTIGDGRFGAGTVSIWDRGTYQAEKWTEREVKVVLTGERARGRFVLLRTRGRNWIIHRMDAPVRPDWRPAPAGLLPMLATAGTLPADSQDGGWAYEMQWDGVRVLARIDGGRLSLRSGAGDDVTARFPELRALAVGFGTEQALLDGVIGCPDAAGRPDPSRLRERLQVGSPAQARALAARLPAVLTVVDLLHHDGRSLLELPYSRRRDQLARLGLAGPFWQCPPAYAGTGSQAVRTSRELGLAGVVAKRQDSPYRPGQRSRGWLTIENLPTQRVVIGGWTPGAGRRSDSFGALLLGLPGEGGLAYLGKVGTGFTGQQRAALAAQLASLHAARSPFVAELPRGAARDARWVTPRLVGAVAYAGWTAGGLLRRPSWRGLRPDADLAELVAGS
jgi:bifunctional non-homologous end joining protein LigD